MKSKHTFGKVIITLLLIIAILGFGWSYYNYSKLKSQIDSSVSSAEMSDEEIQELLDKVSQHIVLPENAVPTIATIKDAEGLAQEQLFFENATNGDKLLLYSEKAIIYSPEKDLLINVGPIYIDSSPNPETVQPENTETTDSTGAAENEVTE